LCEPADLEPPPGVAAAHRLEARAAAREIDASPVDLGRPARHEAEAAVMLQRLLELARVRSGREMFSVEVTSPRRRAAARRYQWHAGGQLSGRRSSLFGGVALVAGAGADLTRRS
jgi:hypothetical protein